VCNRVTQLVTAPPGVLFRLLASQPLGIDGMANRLAGHESWCLESPVIALRFINRYHSHPWPNPSNCAVDSITASSTCCSSSHSDSSRSCSGIATKPVPLKLVLAFHFHVGHNHGKHLFMNVNARYPNKA
jgi:hypothetical protein